MDFLRMLLECVTLQCTAQLTFCVILFCRLSTKLLAQLKNLFLSFTTIENDHGTILVCSHICL